jgi:hypothetical protein
LTNDALNFILVTYFESFLNHFFITPTELRKSLIARGFFVPKSLNTIRGMGMNYRKTIRQKIAAEVVDIKQQGKRYGITFDKFTSIVPS